MYLSTYSIFSNPSIAPASALTRELSLCLLPEAADAIFAISLSMIPSFNALKTVSGMDKETWLEEP